MAVFLGLGVGMALPFLLLGLVPRLRKALPRPGAWLGTFKQLLGFPMLATALWLFWIVGQQVGLTPMISAMAGALLAGLGLWLAGRGSQRLWQRCLAGLLVIAGIGAAVLAVQNAPPKPEGQSSAALLNGEPYSEARLDALLAAQTPVFAYFTADWCITCKLNERGALASDTVAAAFAKRGVATLVGDWTSRDDALARTLARYGRAGVPLYLYFPPGASAAQPIILPQILTGADLVAALSQELPE
jgi:thiol:disulfide interchange protein